MPENFQTITHFSTPPIISQLYRIKIQTRIRNSIIFSSITKILTLLIDRFGQSAISFLQFFQIRLQFKGISFQFFVSVSDLFHVSLVEVEVAGFSVEFFVDVEEVFLAVGQGSRIIYKWPTFSRRLMVSYR